MTTPNDVSTLSESGLNKQKPFFSGATSSTARCAAATGLCLVFSSKFNRATYPLPLGVIRVPLFSPLGEFVFPCFRLASRVSSKEKTGITGCNDLLESATNGPLCIPVCTCPKRWVKTGFSYLNAPPFVAAVSEL